MAMSKFTITREDGLGAPLDIERHELLKALTWLDVADRYNMDKYVRPLIQTRLQEIDLERQRLGLAQTDPTRYAEAEAAIEAAENDETDREPEKQ